MHSFSCMGLISTLMITRICMRLQGILFMENKAKLRSGESQMDRTLKAVYIWIVLALVWMGLELLLYGEIQPRTVDDIMWFLFLPFIYMAVN